VCSSSCSILPDTTAFAPYKPAATWRRACPRVSTFFLHRLIFFFPGGGGGGGGGFPKLELVEGSDCVDGGRRRGH
jgi:hypothetical protein